MPSASTKPAAPPIPRYGTPRRPERPTHGALFAAVAALCGWDLFAWQRYLADVSLEYDRRTRLPYYRTVGVGVARQNGKTLWALVRLAMQLIVPRSLVAYTAQDRNMARFKWSEQVEILMATPFADRVARVSRINGNEGLIMKNGSRYVIVTPKAEKAGRSMSLDLAIIDEAFSQEDMALVGAISPTMAAKPHAQLIVLSNAGTFESTLWRYYTETGRAQVDNPLATLCWEEWAADPDADVLDHEAWQDANPSLDLPHGVTSTALAAAAMGGVDADTMRREHMNIWVDVNAMTGIDAVTWAACRDDDAVPTGRRALSLDFTPERDRGALVGCGDTADGRTAIEVLEAGSDLERLIARAAELANTWNAPIVIDRGGPSASAIPTLERLTMDQDHRVRLVSLPDFVRACGDFHDAAVHARLSHRGDYRLTDAVAGATKRRVGDAWAWRRRGQADISPLVAATLARWGVVAAEEPLQQVVW